MPPAWLVSELVRERSDPVAVLARGGRCGVVAYGLAGPWIARRSHPEGLFASVEIARHGLAAPLLGVNERGLAAAVLPITPAGLGTQQATMLYFFARHGNEAAVLAFGLAFPVAVTLGRCLLGLRYLGTLAHLRASTRPE